MAHIVNRVTQTWVVEPSGPLRGDISVRGSKNAVTKHMVAAMLGDGPSVIRNAPQVGDVDITAAMLESAGFLVSREDGERIHNSYLKPVFPARWDRAITWEQETIDLLDSDGFDPKFKAEEVFDRRFEGIAADAVPSAYRE